MSVLCRVSTGTHGDTNPAAHNTGLSLFEFMIMVKNDVI